MPYRAGERRRKLAAAVLGRDPGPAPRSPEETEPFDVVSGDLLDVSPHLIILETADGEQRRLVIAPWATAWRGGTVAPADLPAGARVVVRALRGGTVAERIWADITRITGVIREISGRRDLTVELDCGPHRRERSIVVPYRSSGRIRVRHPKLEPGYLFDAIGLLDQGTSFAHLPATSQPPYRATAVPPPSVAYGGGDAAGVSGSAVWSDLPGLPDLPDLPGLAEGASRRASPIPCSNARTPAATTPASPAPACPTSRWARCCAYGTCATAGRTRCRSSRAGASRGGSATDAWNVARPRAAGSWNSPRARTSHSVET
ncbi:hypothetical protein GCM10027612_10780 [Microbispora bryophytorum subsp. camponoti]